MSLPAERSTRPHLDFGSKSTAARCRLPSTNLVSTRHVFHVSASSTPRLTPFLSALSRFVLSGPTVCGLSCCLPRDGVPNAYAPRPGQPSAPPTTEQPDLHLALHWHSARFPSAPPAGVDPGHAILYTHVHGVKWVQDMMLLQQQSLSPIHSLLGQRRTERKIRLL